MPDVDFDLGGDRTVDVPDEIYDEGPPEAHDENDPDWTPFDERTDQEKLTAWKRYFESGQTLKTLSEARRVATRIRAAGARRRMRRGRDQISVVSADGAPDTRGDRELTEINQLHRAGHYHRAPAAPEHQYRSAGRNVADIDVISEIDKATFEVGPPDPSTGAFDPSFERLDAGTKHQRWQQYLRFHVGEPNLDAVRRQEAYVEQLARIRAESSIVLRMRDLPGLRTWPKTKVGAVTAIGLASALGGVVSEMLAPGDPGPTATPPPAPPAPPTGVTATAGEGDAAGRSTVTVRWTTPTTPPEPTGYTVVLTEEGGARHEELVGPMATSAEFPDLPKGTYTATVRATRTVEKVTVQSDAIASAAVTAPTPSTPQPSAPDAPTAVELVADTSPVTGLRGITVRWMPPSTGAEVDRYTVRLDKTDQPTSSQTQTDVLGTSRRFDTIDSGTYTATVIAYNDAGGSAPATGGPLTYDQGEAAPPDAVTGVTALAFLDPETNEPAITVRWTPASTGATVAEYQVQLTGGSAVDAVSMTANTSISFPRTGDPVLTDATYTVTVVPANSGGDGPAATATAVVDRSNLVEGYWRAEVSDALVDEWENLRQQLTAADEQTEFWPAVKTAIEDTDGSRGGPATFPQQLDLARVLLTWIRIPSEPPRESQLATIANRLATKASFPTAPPTPGNDYTPVYGLWAAAEDLTTQMGAPLPLRFKLFGIARALEKYLGLRT